MCLFKSHPPLFAACALHVLRARYHLRTGDGTDAQTFDEFVRSLGEGNDDSALDHIVALTTADADHPIDQVLEEIGE